jgi:hypothetical protein
VLAEPAANGKPATMFPHPQKATSGESSIVRRQLARPPHRNCDMSQRWCVGRVYLVVRRKRRQIILCVGPFVIASRHTYLRATQLVFLEAHEGCHVDPSHLVPSVPFFTLD